MPSILLEALSWSLRSQSQANDFGRLVMKGQRQSDILCLLVIRPWHVSPPSWLNALIPHGGCVPQASPLFSELGVQSAEPSRVLRRKYHASSTSRRFVRSRNLHPTPPPLCRLTLHAPMNHGESRSGTKSPSSCGRHHDVSLATLLCRGRRRRLSASVCRVRIAIRVSLPRLPFRA